MHEKGIEHKKEECTGEDCDCSHGSHSEGEGCCCDDKGCSCGGEKECCCKDCCDGGFGAGLSKEEAEKRLTMAATSVWMEMFIEACEKEWKKQAGKSIQKLAAMHVKKAKKEWDEKMK